MIIKTTVKVLFFLTALTGRLTGEVPDPIQVHYQPEPHPLVSDEFNKEKLDTVKWAYRTKNTGSWGVGEDFVKIVAEGDTRFLSLRGNQEQKKGCGISSKHEAHFGLYTLRWRSVNITPEKHTPWHPAIWMAGNNFASGKDARKIDPSYRSNLEIDFIEFWFQPVWHIQTIPWGNATYDSKHKPIQKLRGEETDFPTVASGWQTLGLQYHPDFLQAWEKKDGKWQPIGNRVDISDDRTTESNLNTAHASPGYWIFSNKHHLDNISNNYHFRNGLDLDQFQLEDSWLHIDYFRYFPLRTETK